MKIKVKEKAILKKQKRVNGLVNTKKIVKILVTDLIVVCIGILSIFFAFNISSIVSLTEIARLNHSKKIEIALLEKEIDSLKAELLKNTDILNIQKESKNLGFVYNNDVKYIK